MDFLSGNLNLTTAAGQAKSPKSLRADNASLILKWRFGFVTRKTNRLTNVPILIHCTVDES
jgi:hypothetical protein